MLWQSSYLIWSSLCLLMLDQIHVSSGIFCNPGEKATQSNDRCEPCPKDQFNSKITESNECSNCIPCEMYSLEVSACTPKSNTKCQCFHGFASVDGKERRCKCKTGFGIKNLENGKVICEKCPPNTSTDKINSVCQPQSDFRPTEKFPGNVTSDVNDGNYKAVVLTSSPFPSSQTTEITSNMTPKTSRNLVSTPTTSIPEPQENSKHALWLAALAVFLLLILILKLNRCPEKKADIVRQGSACGKPVEESGEKFFHPI